MNCCVSSWLSGQGRFAITVAATALASVACGASGASTPPREQAAASNAEDEVNTESAPETQATSEPVDPCASGTCSQCGSALCLAGFYCEEEVSACGWLPQCANQLTCECVTAVLTECRCEERGQGIYLNCQ
jgi:hypothetical protein